MDPQTQAAEHGANAAKRSKSKAVAVKRKRSRKKTAKNAAKAAPSPSQALDVATSSSAAVLQGQDQEAVLNDVGKRKKKRRKKKNSNEKKHVVTKRKATGANAGTAVGKADLKASRHVTTDVVDTKADAGLDGPSQAYNTGDFRQFDNAEMEIVNEGVLNHDGRSTKVQAEPEVHDVQNVHTKTIDKDLVKWEHLALIIEEYFLTANNL